MEVKRRKEQSSTAYLHQLGWQDCSLLTVTKRRCGVSVVSAFLLGMDGSPLQSSYCVQPLPGVGMISTVIIKQRFLEGTRVNNTEVAWQCLKAARVGFKC